MNPRTLAHLDLTKGSTNGFSLAGPRNAGLALVALVVFAAASFLLIDALRVQAAAGGSALFNIGIGGNVAVGATVPWTMTITNTSNQDQEDDEVLLDEITGYPSCKTVASFQCTIVADQDPLVFAPIGGGGSGTGACATTTFTIAVDGAADPVPGLWRFTPNAPVTLAAADSGSPNVICSFGGIATVLKLPFDTNAAAPGAQTRQVGFAHGDTVPPVGDPVPFPEEFSTSGTNTVTVHNPVINVTKSPNPTQICTGTSTSVTYSFVVSNPGTATLTGVAVSDSVVPGLQAAFEAANPNAVKTTLTAGQSVPFSLAHSISVTTTNTVTATGILLTVTATDTDTATVTGVACSILVTKSPNPTSICNGVSTSVTYSFVVTNTGAVTLTSVTVSDDKVSGVQAALKRPTRTPSRPL